MQELRGYSQERMSVPRARAAEDDMDLAGGPLWRLVALEGRGCERRSKGGSRGKDVLEFQMVSTTMSKHVRNGRYQTERNARRWGCLSDGWLARPLHYAKRRVWMRTRERRRVRTTHSNTGGRPGFGSHTAVLHLHQWVAKTKGFAMPPDTKFCGPLACEESTGGLWMSMWGAAHLGFDRGPTPPLRLP